jgi:hypothetical protein
MKSSAVEEYRVMQQMPNKGRHMVRWLMRVLAILGFGYFLIDAVSDGLAIERENGKWGKLIRRVKLQ